MRTKKGFSLIELIVTIAIAGIGLSLISTLSSPSQKQLLANDIKAMVQQARFESIKRNVAVAVVWDDNAGNLFMYANTANNTNCSGSNLSLIGTKYLSDYRHVSVSSNLGGSPNKGIIWLPTSTLKDCSNNLVNGTFTVTDTKRDNSTTVTVSQGGKVVVQ